jgi:hypothetical protein
MARAGRGTRRRALRRQRPKHPRGRQSGAALENVAPGGAGHNQQAGIQPRTAREQERSPGPYEQER